MRKRTHKQFLFVFTALLLVMSVPAPSSESLRGTVVAVLAPFFELLAVSQQSLAAPIKESSQVVVSSVELERLRLENKTLRNEIDRLKQLVVNEKHVAALEKELKTATKNHQEIIKNLLKFQFQAMPAQVIFRSPSSWGSSIWLNVGNSSNPPGQLPVVVKNSPVIIGDSIVGVVDYVGAHQCRVRLITDSGLSPSVRVARKDADNRTRYLAKGELHGSSKPLWRSRGIILRGVGFNYDFADEAGVARDLRTGMPVGNSDEEQAIPLLKIKDLLVTTGMDGVFPPGLHVAEVTYVQPLREGDYYYELQAKPTAGNLDDIAHVFVIPPVGYNSDDQPPLIGH